MILPPAGNDTSCGALGRAFGLGLFLSQSVAHGREFYP